MIVVGIKKPPHSKLTCALGRQLPIELSLYTSSGKEIFSYSDTTWWATGFNPKYHDIKSEDMRAKARIDCSDEKEFYEAFKKKYYKDSYLTFNDDSYTITIDW